MCAKELRPFLLPENVPYELSPPTQEAKIVSHTLFQ